MKLVFQTIFVVLLGLAIVSAVPTKVITPTWTVQFDAEGEYGLPTFTFHKNLNPVDMFSYSFQQLFEAQEKNREYVIEGEAIKMNTLNWTVSEVAFDNKTSNYTFTITSTGVENRFKQLKISAELSSLNRTAAASVKCKLTIFIEDYHWVESFTQLVLSTSLRHANKNDSSNVNQPSKKYVQLNNSFVQDSELSATSIIDGKDGKQHKSTSVLITTRVEDDLTGSGTTKKIYFVYNEFQGSLSHSPVFGLGAPDEDNGGRNSILMAICIGGVLVLAILGLVATFIIKRHRKHYMLISQEQSTTQPRP